MGKERPITITKLISLELQHSRAEEVLRKSSSDNGLGIPEDLDFRNTESLGLQLINMLVEQLDGTFELDRMGGTAFKITFKGLKDKDKA